MTAMDLKKTVFRLRNLPETMETTEDVAVHLSERLSVTVADITVRSLARSLEHWEKSPTKVATVMFKVHPSCVQEKPAGDQWYIPAMGNNRTCRRFILDTHFRGLTPLNDSSHLQTSYE